MEHPKLKWEAVQVELRARLCAKDDDGEDFSSGKSKRYIGGVDISFSAIDSSVACATLVIVDTEAPADCSVVYEDSIYPVSMSGLPYIAGYLAFREVPPLLQLLQKLRKRIANEKALNLML